MFFTYKKSTTAFDNLSQEFVMDNRLKRENILFHNEKNDFCHFQHKRRTELCFVVKKN